MSPIIIDLCVGAFVANTQPSFTCPLSVMETDQVWMLQFYRLLTQAP